MGGGLVVPWVGTSGPATDGLYVAVVGFGGEGVRAAVERVRLSTDVSGTSGSEFDPNSMTVVDLASAPMT